MSHFTVTVVGENIEDQLIPFIEQVNENPIKYAKYRKFKNCSEKVRRDWNKDTIKKWYSQFSVSCDNPKLLDIMEGLIQKGEYYVYSLEADCFGFGVYKLKEIANGIASIKDEIHGHEF